jgi:hypothetical protein
MTTAPFPTGSTVVRRDIFNGKIWTAAAHRVLADNGQQLSLACWPGSPSYVPTTWIRWLHDRDDATRQEGIPHLASGQWQLGAWTWQDTATLTWVGCDPDFSVIYFRAVTGGTEHWKINFERPIQRTPDGIDTFDLLLDLTADPSADRWSWKDEQEYEQARRLGIIGDAEHRRVQAARERAVAFVESRSGPLGHDWSTWQVPVEWPALTLAPHALDAPAR